MNKILSLDFSVFRIFELFLQHTGACSKIHSLYNTVVNNDTKNLPFNKKNELIFQNCLTVLEFLNKKIGMCLGLK